MFNICLWAVEKKCMVTLENPATSYLWKFLENLYGPADARDIVLSQCRFGTTYRKETKIICFGCNPTELDKRCGLWPPLLNTYLCGTPNNVGHQRLGSGDQATRPTASYPAGLCRADAKFASILWCEGQSRAATMEAFKLS